MRKLNDIYNERYEYCERSECYDRNHYDHDYDYNLKNENDDDFCQILKLLEKPTDMIPKNISNKIKTNIKQLIIDSIFYNMCDVQNFLIRYINDHSLKIDHVDIFISLMIQIDNYNEELEKNPRIHCKKLSFKEKMNESKFKNNKLFNKNILSTITDPNQFKTLAVYFKLSFDDYSNLFHPDKINLPTSKILIANVLDSFNINAFILKLIQRFEYNQNNWFYNLLNILSDVDNENKFNCINLLVNLITKNETIFVTILYNIILNKNIYLTNSINKYVYDYVFEDMFMETCCNSNLANAIYVYDIARIFNRPLDITINNHNYMNIVCSIGADDLAQYLCSLNPNYTVAYIDGVLTLWMKQK